MMVDPEMLVMARTQVVESTTLMVPVHQPPPTLIKLGSSIQESSPNMYWSKTCTIEVLIFSKHCDTISRDGALKEGRLATPTYTTREMGVMGA